MGALPTLEEIRSARGWKRECPGYFPKRAHETLVNGYAGEAWLTGRSEAIHPLDVVLAVEAAGIRHRYIGPRRPQQNGEVERSHWTDQEEFWGRHRFTGFDEAATAVRVWERTCNFDRFSLALQGARQPRDSPAFCRVIAPVLPTAIQTAGERSILTRPNTLRLAAST